MGKIISYSKKSTKRINDNFCDKKKNQVNAMDVLAVRESIKFARKYCITDNKGPLFIEFATYRFYGHSVADPGTR